MKNTKKIYIAIAIAIVAVISIFGLYYPVAVNTITNSFGAVGDTNSTSKIASCVLDTSTTTPTYATTSSATTGCLYNADSKDRFITSVDYYITGLNGSVSSNIGTTTWKMGTSTDFYTPGASYVLNTSIATSSNLGTVQNTLYVASTTPGLGATFPYRIWNTGTNLNLLQNSTTSGATATIVVRYFINN